MSQELKEQILKGVVTILLFTSVFFAARQAAVLVNEGEAETEERFCVVIDAGHGGTRDPGAVYFGRSPTAARGKHSSEQLWGRVRGRGAGFLL